ncbi:MAG: hypothetical protein K2G37_06250, partial [Clostridia bacterium]|nr:hypothetical protein [Clostridia bacterium]
MSFVLAGLSDKDSAKALDATGLTSATKVGDGVDLWNSSVGAFNGEVINDLKDKLFGDEDPETYIETNGVDPHNFKSTVVTASQINANAGNATYGLIITLGGYQWMITSLTFDNTDDKNIVMTLYMATPIMTSKYGENTSARGNNAYSTSAIRTTLLTDSKFSMFASGDFAEEYLVQPKNINYQHYQNHYKCAGGKSYTLGNESLETPDGVKWYSSSYSYSPETTYNFNGWSNVRYDDWGKDYIWLPSVTEVAWKGYNDKDHIWMLTDAQRNYSTTVSSSAWLRSADYNVHNQSEIVGSSGGYSCPNVSSNYGVRPAIHLNLTEAMGAAAPEDVSVVYTGGFINIKTAATTAKANWYTNKLDAAITDGIVRVAYVSGNLTNGYPKNVGSYDITFTIQNLSANSPFIWKGDDMSNPQIATKQMTLTIKPKPLEVDFKVDPDATPPATATPTNLCESDNGLTNSILQIYYEGTETGTGATYPSSLIPPTKVGVYTATVKIDTTVEGSGNYELAQSYNEPLKIDPRIIAIPTIEAEAGSTYPYTYSGGEMAYIFEYDSDVLLVEYGDGYSEDDFEINEEYGVIFVTNAGNYTNAIKLTLKNALDKTSGEGINVWDINNDTTPKYLSFVVNKAELKLDVYTSGESDSTTIYGLIGSSTLPVIVSLRNGDLIYQVFGSDSVNVTLTATRIGSSSAAPTDLCSFVINNRTTTVNQSLNISSFRVAAKYQIGVKVESNNYDVDMLRNVTLEMSRTVESPNLIWWLSDNSGMEYKEEAEVGQTSVTFAQTKLVYDSEKTYTLEASAPKGYTLQGNPETYKGGVLVVGDIKGAGEYVSKVTIVNSSSGATTEYTMTWKIEKALFDLSEVEWINEVEYDNGNKVSPSFKNLPEGLEYTLAGAIIENATVGEKGSVTVTFKPSKEYEDNYEWPVQSDSSSYIGSDNFTWTTTWKIVPVEIKLDWVYKDAEDANGKPFKVLVLSDSRIEGKVDYLYYETNMAGEKLDENEDGISESEIEVPLSGMKFYIAYPVLQSTAANNYKFPDGASWYSPTPFSVGDDATAITVSLTSDKYVYTAKGVALKWAAGTPTGSLNFTYYAGDAFGNKIDYVPTSIGYYWVEVASNNAALVISGDTKFKFEITKNIISTDWNESAKPPVLRNLTSLQLKEGIEYEYYDKDMHKVDLSALSAGGDFYIRAVLKDTLNFEFDNGEVETQTVAFSVSSGDTIRDPSDIDNPNYDFDDEENPDDTDPTPTKTDIT